MSTYLIRDRGYDSRGDPLLYRTIFHLLGHILILTGLSMVPSLVVGLYYQEIEATAVLISIGITILSGHLLKGDNLTQKIHHHEAFFVVITGWILISLFGALPYFLSRSSSFINSFFESISGFTTTGATIFSHPENLSNAILLWRSTTQWLGGMGIILLYLVLLPERRGDFNLYDARGPTLPFPYTVDHLRKKMVQIWSIYISMTVLLFLLLLTIGELVPFEALLYSLTTISTGGFSQHSESMSFFQQRGASYCIILFMVLSGLDFKNYLLLFTRERRHILQNKESLLYLSTIICTTLILSLHLCRTVPPIQALHLALFQTTSIVSTTAYTIIDYDIWSSFAKALLILLMLMGGSSGSTAGGIKMKRIYYLFRLVKEEIEWFIYQKKRSHHKKAYPMLSFFFLYLLLISFFTLALTHQGLDLMSAFTASAATLGNIGPGFGLLGPKESYCSLNHTSKILLSLAMLLGCLEIFSFFAFIYILVVPSSKTNPS